MENGFSETMAPLKLRKNFKATFNVIFGACEKE